MPRPALPALRRIGAHAAAGALAIALAAGVVVLPGAGAASAPRAAKKANVVTPGSFTGFGFDQCQAPSQAKMDTWLETSPFLAAGIYIDGDSRACRNQKYLDATWVATQLAKGWRLLPITLGPQASCNGRFPRYDDDFRISPKVNSAGVYAVALQQGKTQATKTAEVAEALGIAPRSTLWYDLEAFDHRKTACRESALTFLSGWTQQLHEEGYVSGVYSSAGSGILALDNARVNRPDKFTMPDAIWLADWDQKANTSSKYIRADGWTPHRRVKQFMGGHNETWGGVTINIDRNFLDVGRGSAPVGEKHCGGVPVTLARYGVLRPPTANTRPDAAKVKALQCLLKETGYYKYRVHGYYGARVIKAVNAWQAAHGLPVTDAWGHRAWMTLLSTGRTPVIKYGSASPAVRRLQRTLKATGSKGPKITEMTQSGVFDAPTVRAVREWQKRIGLPVTGVVGAATWASVQAGQR